MNREENSDSIPTDLFLEIFSRLPAKSIGRFSCVSKQWWSLLRSPCLTKMFLTRSSAHPRLLFIVERDDEWRIFSSPQPQNTYGKSSLVVAADLHMTVSQAITHFSYASGLIYFYNMHTRDYTLPVICNPITGQYAILPNRERHTWCSLLGFDPIDKQFKLLMKYSNERVHHILTLGADKEKWRKIQCPFTHKPLNFSICINGVLYYLAYHFDEVSDYSRYVIVCFDVRSEKFKFIEAQCILPQYGIKFINYKGKLGMTELTNGNDVGALELHMWILEDVGKQEWSKYVYTLPKNKIFNSYTIEVVGVTAGEIVLSERFITSKFFNVFYFNPERNTLQQLEIQGLGAELKDRGTVYTFVDHVEDFRMIASKQLKSSISAPSVNNKRGLNIIRGTSKPQHREEVRERDRDRKYDDGKLKDHKHTKRGNEGDKREDEDRRKRRNREAMRDIESRRDR